MMIKLREFEGKNSLLIISVDRLTGFKNIRNVQNDVPGY